MTAVAPRLRRFQHRAESAEHVENRFPAHVLRQSRNEVLLRLNCELFEPRMLKPRADVGPQVRLRRFDA